MIQYISNHLGDPYVQDLYATFQYLLETLVDDQTEKEMILYALIQIMRKYQPEKSHSHPECDEWVTEALLLSAQFFRENRSILPIENSTKLSICQLRIIQDKLLSLI